MSKQPSTQQVLFQPTGIPPLGSAVSLALQHLVAMIVGCVTPAIIVANAIGMPQDQRVLLIQSSLVLSAVATLLQIFPIGGKNSRLRFGSGLPVILGVSFAYVPSMEAIAKGSGTVATIAGAMVVGGIVALIVGLGVEKIRVFFPPVITGTVVFTIGLSLYPTAINYMAGGTANTYELVVETKGLTPALVYGSWQNWLVAAITLIAVMVLNNKGKGIAKLASILIGMVFGYIVSAFFGMVSFADVGSSSWFALPEFMPFGIDFDPAACIAIGMFVSSLTENQIIAVLGTFAILLLTYLMSGIRTLFTTGSSLALIVFTVLLLVISLLVGLNSKSLSLGCMVFVLGGAVLLALFKLKSAALTTAFSGLLGYLSIFDPFQNFVGDLFSITAIVYYLSVAGLFLFLTGQSLEKRRWN